MNKLTIVIIAISVFLGLGIAVFFIMFGQMIFVSKISKNKIKTMPEYEILSDGVHIEEIPNEMEILDREYRPDDSNRGEAKDFLVKVDGYFEDDKRYFDDDERKEILLMFNNESNYDFAFIDGTIFKTDGEQKQSILHEFTNPALSFARFAAPVYEDRFVMIGDLKEVDYADSKLWMVDKNTFQRTLLSEDPYFEFTRAPLIISDKKSEETFLIHYSGDVHFGFGGDASRPKDSIIRLYDGDNPDGKDLIKISFSAGTVVDIMFKENECIVVTDPSLPSAAREERETPRTWKLDY